VIVWPIMPQVNIPTETDEDRTQRLEQIIGAELTFALQKLAALRGRERVIALVSDSLKSQGRSSDADRRADTSAMPPQRLLFNSPTSRWRCSDCWRGSAWLVDG